MNKEKKDIKRFITTMSDGRRNRGKRGSKGGGRCRLGDRFLEGKRKRREKIHKKTVRSDG